MSELQGLQLHLPEFRAAGAEVLAVSVDSVAENRAVVDRLGLGFAILSDGGREATRAFGVLHEAAMGEGRDIARPATFICDRGVIVWRDLTDNWRVRPRPREVLDALGRARPAGPRTTSAQGIPPAQPREAREVGVVRDELALVLDRERRQVRVGGERPGHTDRRQQLPQDAEMSGARLEELNVLAHDPLLDAVERLGG
jgi:peroxiredoxin